MSKRHELMHYFDTSMGKETGYALLGDGIASLTEEMNPEEDTKQWINNANGSTSVKSYTPSLEVEKEDCIDDSMQECINRLVDTLPTGSESESYYVRLRLKDKVSDGVYKAYRRKCAVLVNSSGGDAGDNVKNSIKIGGRGDAVAGTFDISTNKFAVGDVE